MVILVKESNLFFMSIYRQLERINGAGINGGDCPPVNLPDLILESYIIFNITKLYYYLRPRTSVLMTTIPGDTQETLRNHRGFDPRFLNMAHILLYILT